MPAKETLVRRPSHFSKQMFDPDGHWVEPLHHQAVTMSPGLFLDDFQIGGSSPACHFSKTFDISVWDEDQAINFVTLNIEEQFMRPDTCPVCLLLILKLC